MIGEDVLRLLVERKPDAPMSPRFVAWKLTGKMDGRKAAPALLRLRRAGLAVQASVARPAWIATGRGREVNRILDEITAARGGQFKPRYQAGITPREDHALR